MTAPPSAEADAVKSHSDCVGQLVCDVLGTSLESVNNMLKLAATRWDEDPEYVHQLRVSSRRALAAIELFSDLIPASDTKWFTKKLTAILQSAGKARDLDVLIQNRLPKCGPAAAPLGKIWRKQRRSYQSSIVRVQKKMQKKDCLKTRTRSLVRDLKRSNQKGSGLTRQHCGDWARMRVPDLCRQFFSAVPGRADADLLHHLRILTKRFRYMLAILQSALHSKEISETHAALEQLQKQLGMLQDHVMARKQFQKSLKYLESVKDQKLLQRLIRKEDRKIARRVARFQLESDSNSGQQLRFCIDAVMSMLSAAESGFR